MVMLTHPTRNGNANTPYQKEEGSTHSLTHSLTLNQPCPAISRISKDRIFWTVFTWLDISKFWFWFWWFFVFLFVFFLPDRVSYLKLTLFFFKIYLFIICKYTVAVFRHSRRGNQILLHMVVSHHVVAGIWTSDLRRAVRCSYPLSHLTSPYACIIMHETTLQLSSDTHQKNTWDPTADGCWKLNSGPLEERSVLSHLSK